VHPVLFHIGAILIPSYGALASVGVLLGLFLAQRTARMAGVNAAHMWNLCVIALFAALVSERLLLVVMNFSDLRRHPRWMLALAMIHHPLLTVMGAIAGIAAATAYGRWQRMPLWTTADALAAPLALGLACEQLGALLAGSSFGTETSVRWAVVYTNPLAARWSGTPLGVPLHPVQAYAGVAFVTLSLLLVLWMPVSKQPGDVAGLWLLGSGVAIYMTEIWRDTEGRGAMFGGAIDMPQFAAVFFVLAGGLVLMDRKQRVSGRAIAGLREAMTQAPGLQSAEEPEARKEAQHG
jgi:phosphatidylglycerol:prolipoprotein diacylglycerol transferase